MCVYWSHLIRLYFSRSISSHILYFSISLLIRLFPEIFICITEYLNYNFISPWFFFNVTLSLFTLVFWFRIVFFILFILIFVFPWVLLRHLFSLSYSLSFHWPHFLLGIIYVWVFKLCKILDKFYYFFNSVPKG